MSRNRTLVNRWESMSPLTGELYRPYRRYRTDRRIREGVIYTRVGGCDGRPTRGVPEKDE